MTPAVALVLGALERYLEEDRASQEAFRSGAERGRPPVPAPGGVTVALADATEAHRLTVCQTSPDTFQVECGGVEAEVGLTRLPGRTRILAVADGKVRADVALSDGQVHVIVDSHRWSLRRADGYSVRAPFPAFVSAMHVGVGDRVQQGQTVAVVEAMKMESQVRADVDGVVAEVAVLANSQVNAGAELVRIELLDDEVRPAVGSPDIADLCLDRGSAVDQLRHYLLGYERSGAALARLVRTVSDPSRPAEPEREDKLIDLFVDTAALVSPATEHETDLGPVPAGEYLRLWQQTLDPDRAGLPSRYRRRLSRVLEDHGIASLAEDPKLAEAARRVFAGTTRLPEVAPAVRAILRRRLAAPASSLSPEDSLRLDRLVGVTESRFEPVAEAARDLRFRLVDEPALTAGRSASWARTEQVLACLEASPGSERDDLVARLVDSPYPVTGQVLRRRMGDASPAMQRLLLEVRARRRYRDLLQGGLRWHRHRGTVLGSTRAVESGRERPLLLAAARVADVPSLGTAVASALRSVKSSEPALVDVLAWAPTDPGPEVAGLIAGWPNPPTLSRLQLTVSTPAGPSHYTFDATPDGLQLRPGNPDVDPMLDERLELWRLAAFDLRRLPAPDGIQLFHGTAKEDPADHRLFALAEVRDLTPRPDDSAEGGRVYPDLERVGLQSVAAMREALEQFPPKQRPRANRLTVFVRPTWDIPPERWTELAERVRPLAPGAGLDLVVIRADVPDVAGIPRPAEFRVQGLHGCGVTISKESPKRAPIRPLTSYQRKALTASRLGVPYPWEVLRVFAPSGETVSGFDPGDFVEHDLDEFGRLVPVDREPGENTANVVVGLIRTYTSRVPEGMLRVAILSDPTNGFGSLAEPECRRIDAALDLAEELGVPAEWFAVSSGALISTDSGTENMDWIAGTLRRIVEYTQAGGELNVVVTGINVGGQAYWNAEATMMMHTRGVLVQVAGSAMVLTGKQALDFSGGVSDTDNLGIGGYARVMGGNGQAQYRADSVEAACRVLAAHYAYTYVVPGERFPRARRTTDAVQRDICASPHPQVPGTDFARVGEIFSDEHNPARKRPFDIRAVMRSVTDADAEPLERWEHWAGAENAVVWDTAVGGHPVAMIGIESRQLPRRGPIPADGPESWTAGTLFPQASRKVARAINSVAGRRPVVVLANLSGFDGSPESLRNWQLEYGAEIGRAVINFDGPIVLVVVSRYHGGAFVVFSKALNPRLEVAAVEGAFASVIGGAPAAATVFAREVKRRVVTDPRTGTVNGSTGASAQVLAALRSEHLGHAAEEFDAVHTIERARRVGSIDTIIAAEQVRPYVVDAVRRGMLAA
jgi:acetyl-CoA carboxylase carboxyltransferase component/biotin carboxyl carrier protein